jgi:hypothetical protein
MLLHKRLLLRLYIYVNLLECLVKCCLLCSTVLQSTCVNSLECLVNDFTHWDVLT